MRGEYSPWTTPSVFPAVGADLLASRVLAVVACRSLRLPPMIGYLVTGVALGPHALGVVSEREETRCSPSSAWCS